MQGELGIRNYWASSQKGGVCKRKATVLALNCSLSVILRGPKEFLAWEASKDKWDGLGRLESLDQMDLKGHRANQGHR